MSSTPSESLSDFQHAAEDVLVIEDIRTFRFPATYARTRERAWFLLFASGRLRPWKEVWFDYDLGISMDADNSYDLAVEMERRAQEGIPLLAEKVYVHTANPAGGDRLMAALSPWYDVKRVEARDYIVPGSAHNEWRYEE